MAPVRIIGRKPRLEQTLARLYDLRLVQLATARGEQGLELEPLEGRSERLERIAELRLLLARVEGLLELSGGDAAIAPPGSGVDAERLSHRLDELAPGVESLVYRLAELRTEQAVLPRYLEPLRKLLPLVPELTDLDEHDLTALQLDTIALVLNTDDDAVADTLRSALRELLGDRFELVARRVDADAIGCVIVFRRGRAAEVQALLGREHVRRTALPSRYQGLSFRMAVRAMEDRLQELPGTLAEAGHELEALLAPEVASWDAARSALAAELERIEAVEQAAGTSRAFVVTGWVPTAQLGLLREELERTAAGELVVEEATGVEDEPPVLMRNPPPARPFELLVRFLDLPRPGSLDPTMLVALFLPLMVGAMVGDVAYGVLLLAGSLLLRRRFGTRSAAVRDLARVFVAGSVWAIVFGLLFGEILGDVGKRLGFHALWFYRGGEDAVETLLLLSLALGAAHVSLGLVLGLGQSARARRLPELLERAGSLLGLLGAIALAVVAADRVPAPVVVPAIVALIAGLVLVSSPRGALGLIMGPLELIGTLGNVLSYLRIAAVGLASASLAVVANRLAGIGPLWLGLPVAVLFHTLNIALAAFTPTIQALRLHYVEFFSKFYDGGGQAFRPFGGPAAP